MRISARPPPVSLRIALPWASSALIGIVLLSSCGSDSSGDGIGAGAQGGSSAGGAGTGGSGAGQGGSGAAAGAPVGSAGSTSGGAFGAGLAGSSAGGAGNGDAGASEGGGAGDAAAGASGTGDAGAGEAGAGGSGSGGAAGDGAGGTGGGGTGGAGGSGDSIESCFAGLRPLQGISQIPTRENLGEQIRLRLALETADRISTSGTFPWAAVRLGLEIDGILICLDEAALASAYELSLHNCADVLTFESGGQRYEITDPDEPGGEAGMSLTVFSGASPVRGPIPLTTTACVAGGSAITQCRSGGPC